MIAHRLSQATVKLKHPSSVAIWAEKVLVSLFSITSEEMWKPHSRRRKLLKEMEEAMFKDEFEMKLLDWSVDQDGKAKREAALLAFRLNEKHVRRQRKILFQMWHVVSDQALILVS